MNVTVTLLPKRHSGPLCVTLGGNTASGCIAGFDLSEGANHNTLRGNTANNNNHDGVGGNGFSLEIASDNVLSHNTANGNSFGFNLGGANANELTGNTANHNSRFGFAAWGGANHNTLNRTGFRGDSGDWVSGDLSCA